MIRRAGACLVASALALTAGAGLAHQEHGASQPPVVPGGQRFEFEAPAPGSYRLPPIKPAPDAALIDPSGRPARLHRILGDRVVLLSFVYLQCTDACPVASAVLRQVRRTAARDPRLRERLALVTISFDPERDTPEALAAHAQAWRAGARQPPWHFYTAPSPAAAQAMVSAYGQPVRRVPEADADIAHLLRVYLVDRQRRLRNIYGLGFLDPRLLLADVRTLLQEADGEP